MPRSTYLSSRWHIYRTLPHTVMEQIQLTDRISMERAGLFRTSPMGRMKIELQASRLSPFRDGQAIFQTDERVGFCRVWMNGTIVLLDLDIRPIGMDDLYPHVAVLLLSHLTINAFRYKL